MLVVEMSLKPVNSYAWNRKEYLSKTSLKSITTENLRKRDDVIFSMSKYNCMDGWEQSKMQKHI